MRAIDLVSPKIKICCSVWNGFDLVPFAQFKKREKTLKPATLLKLTLLCGWFSHFLNSTNDTKSCESSHMRKRPEASYNNITNFGPSFSSSKRISGQNFFCLKEWYERLQRAFWGFSRDFRVECKKFYPTYPLMEIRWDLRNEMLKY